MPLPAVIHAENLTRTRNLFLSFASDWERLENTFETPHLKGDAGGKAYAYRAAAAALEHHITALSTVD